MAQYIVVSENESYPIDTDAERAEACEAMRVAGLGECAVFFGDPDDPSSYAAGKRFTSKGEVFSG